MNLSTVKRFLGKYPKHVEAWKAKEPFPPIEVEIQPRSTCNLKCWWCIGTKFSDDRLPNTIDLKAVVEKIIRTSVNGFGIQRVMLSGLMGEPLLYPKDELVYAIWRLYESNKQIGLFTNGILMTTKNLLGILRNIEYVHVSLDAGPESYRVLKGGRWTTFDRVIGNIKRLADLGGPVKINVGYVVTKDNSDEIYKVTELVKEAGAHSIRFKCDISERNAFGDGVQLRLVQADFANDRHRKFKVVVEHTQLDIVRKLYQAWDCKQGCQFRYFFGTVGSNGCMYLCDHNTIPRGISLIDLNAQEYSFRNIDDVECVVNVCPPFANAMNIFLKEMETGKRVRPERERGKHR